jgi:aspartate kinase
MQELALHGAKVLNAQAVEFARRAGIVIYARATAGSSRSTMVIGHREQQTSAVGVTGMKDLICVHGDGGTAQLQCLVKILEEHPTSALYARLIEGQPVLLLSRDNCHDYGLLRSKLEKAGGMVWFEEGLEAVSIVGEGLGDDPRHLAKALSLLDSMELPIHSLDTAPLRLTVFLRPGRMREAVQALHRVFIEQEPGISNELSASSV